ncbi:Aste57867_8453 [Aphanomyces stellatus]|uniref:Aste57867_8453 protein n=1 Tax=Aphanomyces stellatus TaxID=120398 RepID=A0A485KKA8_9STRA|nr:hypothetical protein As57867_008421 [Aphanomyces stellatus]VFT85339.1 Aste57867_8453 [Aphanomyces stellatus]
MANEAKTDEASFRQLDHVEVAEAPLDRDTVLTKANRKMAIILGLILFFGIGSMFIWRFGFNPPFDGEFTGPPLPANSIECHVCSERIARSNVSLPAQCPQSDAPGNGFSSSPDMLFCRGVSTPPCCCPGYAYSSLKQRVGYSDYKVSCAPPDAVGSTQACACHYKADFDVGLSNFTVTLYMLVGIGIVVVVACMWGCVWCCHIRGLKRSLPQ